MAQGKPGRCRSVVLPPDSNGERMGTLAYHRISYSGGVLPFVRGLEVVGDLSGAVATILDVYGATAAGEVALIYGLDLSLAHDTQKEFQSGEDLLVGGVRYATSASLAVPTSVAINTLASGTNPKNLVEVDDQGALHIRFAEGSQQLDAYGLTRHTTPHQLAQYVFPYGLEDPLYTDEASGTGALSHLAPARAAVLSVGLDAGAKMVRTTNRYHIQQAGFGQLIKITALAGDVGKTNLRRRMGYFDADDGVYLEMVDTTIYIVLRSSVSGSVVEERVAQSDWNGDGLNGYGLSGVTLDPTKLNLFWFDLAGPFAGPCRFGIMAPDGARITCHKFDNGNRNSGPYMRTASLPVRYEIENLGATSGVSSLMVTGSTVETEGVVVDDRERYTNKRSGETPPRTVALVGDTYLAAFRSAEFVNGFPNRHYTVPEFLAGYSSSEAIVVKVYKNSTIPGVPSFMQVSGTAMEMDISGGGLVTDGDHMLTWVFPAGVFNQTMPENFGVLGHNLIRNADLTAGEHLVLTARSLGAVTTDVTLWPTWIDVA